MKNSILAFLLIFLIVKYSFGNENELKGTELASPEDFTYQVSLRSGNRHYCSGVIIDVYWILTTYVCSETPDGNVLTIHVGVHKLYESGYVYEPEKVIKHPSYDSKLLYNDIALIKVQKPITFDTYANSIPLPSVKKQDFKGTAIISGWGEINIDDVISYSNNLRYTEASIVSEWDCPVNVPLVVRDAGKICVVTTGETAYVADAGSPLYQNGSVVGLAIFLDDRSSNFSKIFTDISWQLVWIKDILDNN